MTTSRSRVIEAKEAHSYDGYNATEIAAMLSLPRVLLFEQAPSTLDIAHRLADEGAESGTLVIADEQTAGRGRMGRTWHSERGRGIWLTLVERPAATEILSVLSLRVALALAPALEHFAEMPIRLKWPNDVYVGKRKLAGVLLEARWRGSRLDWLAAGVGINVRAPESYDAGSLAEGTDRIAVLRSVVPGLRRALVASGPLSPAEISAFAARDFALGLECELPVAGRVAGIDASGALLVDTEGRRAVHHGGSLVLVDRTTKSGGTP